MSGKTYYYPSCKVKAAFPGPSAWLGSYLKERYGIEPAGCCRTHFQDPEEGDTALVICNNCASIFEENSAGKLKYVWELIDGDPDFPFPDYGGERMTVQDCWIAFERRSVQDAVRSLLKKMRIEAVEQEENYGKTTFCGTFLLSPCSPGNLALAPKRYAERFPHMFTPMAPEEQEKRMRAHCRAIGTEKVVCYCRPCTAGIRLGGKTAVHLLELLFPES